MIGREAREQMLAAEGRLPGGGRRVRRRRLERDRHLPRLPRRRGRPPRRRRGRGRRLARHAAAPPSCTAPARRCSPTRTARSPTPTRSRPGLDYPGVGPEHAYLRDSGRAVYVAATDAEALAAFQDLARTEGIIPALEPAHALARARDLDAELILVCLSGRGDKDLAEALAALDPEVDHVHVGQLGGAAGAARPRQDVTSREPAAPGRLPSERKARAERPARAARTADAKRASGT